MNVLTRLFALALLACPALVAAQLPASAPERGAYLTIFRSPATGIEVRSGHAAAYAGFYPTIIGKDGKRGNANFIRLGGTWYLKDHGSSLYLSPSALVSLDDNWKNGTLTELGFRGKLYRGLKGRLGAAVLVTTDGEIRVNPTVGMDVKLGRGR